MDHVVLIVGFDDADFDQDGAGSGPTSRVKSGWSGREIDAVALLIAWRMSSEIPCRLAPFRDL